MSRKSALSSAALLALLTMGGTAFAGQTLSGTYIEANYGDNGMWNWGSTGTGLIYTTTGSGASQDATYPGTPWAHFQVEFDQYSSSYNQIANSSSGTTLTVVSESNESDSSTLISVYEYTAGDLEITKTEYWEMDGTVIAQQFALHNAGSSDITNLRFQVATDPDHDLNRFGTYSTLNDVDDLDGDGVSDWTVSLGPSSGIAFGFAPCDPDSATLGHSPGWDQDADLSLTDYNFGSGDYSMNWVHYEGTLAAGDTAYASNLVVFADDATTAEGLVSSEADMCNICDSDGDGALASWCGGDDCDDDDPTVYPSASEVCDGVDNDCDGTVDEDDAIDAQTWYQDADSDGYGNASVTDIDCYQPTGYVADDTDCDDSVSSTYPGADEYCNGVDDDCDGTIDEDSAVDASTWYQDADSDGYGNASVSDVECAQPTGYVADSSDCDDTVSTTYPGAPEYCNSVDDDCDGTVDEDSAVDASTWYQDADSDGYGNVSVADIECYQPTGFVADSSDCDDTVSTTYPGADEYCNGVDDDCDGTIDEDDAVDVSTWYADSDSDSYGDASVSDIDCSQPTGYVADSTDCDDAEPTTYPGADEYCDGVDNDCDGDIDEDSAVDASTWYEDGDGDGYGEATVSDVECNAPSGYVADDTDCDDNEPTTYPGADEYCDGVDNDCDTVIDEDDAVDVVTWYYDQDGDTYGDPSLSDIDCNQPEGMVEDNTDCNDYDDTVYPGAEEIEYDGIDQDCDGEDLCDVDLDTYNAVECGGSDCDDEDEDVNVDAEETWYDGIDQDCDGLSDYDADYDGYDSESYEGDDCDDADPETYPGAPDEYYDGIVNDCDAADEYDADGDGEDAIEYGGEDCDDANSEINPDMPETWYDGVDQDCDGIDDDQDSDGYGVDDDCDDLDAESFPGAEGLDENCDSTVDENVDGLSGDSGFGGVGLDGATGGGGASCGGTKTAATFAFFGLLGLGLGRRRRRD